MKKINIFILVIMGLSLPVLLLANPDIETILREIHALQNKKGVYISGRGKFDYQYFRVNGDNINTNAPVVGDSPLMQADFILEGRPFQFLKIAGTVRLENNIAGFYGVGSTFSALDLYMDTILYRFVRLRLGNFRMKLSPLTLWLTEDNDPFEPTILKKHKNDEYYENFLQNDNSYHLEGGYLDFGFQFGSQNANFVSSSIVPDTIKMKSYVSKIDTAANSAAYDRYMFGGQVDIYKENIYQFQWNGNFVYDWELTKKPGTIQNILHTGVYDFSGKWNILNFLFGTKGIEKSFTLTADYAQSYTLTNSINKNNITDYAFIPGMKLSYANTKLYGQMIDVGNEFYAPGAQSWSYNSTGWSYLAAQALEDNLLFNNYNTKVQIIHRFNRPLHISQPMGLATPNRKGFVAGLKSESLKFFTAEGSFTSLDEIRPIGNDEKRQFQKIYAGGKFAFNQLINHYFIPIFTGSYAIENEKRNDDASTATNESEKIDTQMITAGIEIPMTKRISLLGGFKQIVQKGHTYFDIDNSNTPLRIDGYSIYNVDFVSQEILGGILYKLNEFSSFRLDGTYIIYKNTIDTIKNYNFYLIQAFYVIQF